MNKKGQGLSLNVIIIAVLALLVLVVLSVIFIGRLGVFTKGVSSCEEQPNHLCTSDSGCQSRTDGSELDGYVKDSSYNCKDVDEVPMTCCLKLV